MAGVNRVWNQPEQEGWIQPVVYGGDEQGLHGGDGPEGRLRAWGRGQVVFGELDRPGVMMSQTCGIGAGLGGGDGQTGGPCRPWSRGLDFVLRAVGNHGRFRSGSDIARFEF